MMRSLLALPFAILAAAALPAQATCVSDGTVGHLAICDNDNNGQIDYVQYDDPAGATTTVVQRFDGSSAGVGGGVVSGSTVVTSFTVLCDSPTGGCGNFLFVGALVGVDGVSRNVFVESPAPGTAFVRVCSFPALVGSGCVTI